TFDGDGHRITGLYINSTNDYQGLFGCVGSGGVIKNLGVDGYVKGGYYVGGVCGWNNGRIENCYNTGDVSGTNGVGGVCGYNDDGRIENSYNAGEVTATSIYSHIGGVCGYNNGGRIENSYNAGEVTATSSYSHIGGVCGYNYGGRIENCYNTGDVSGSNDSSVVGGVCGYNDGTITNCYYLKTDTINNDINAIGNEDSETAGKAESKTTEQFAGGEVAHLLQSAQEEDTETGAVPMVWGQTISADNFPVLTSDSAKTVYKVTFVVKDSAGQNGYKEHAAAYANYNGTVALPTAPASDTYAFVKWSQTASISGAEFKADTPVTDDMTVYAVGELMYGENDNEKTVTTTYGTAAETDLSAYIAMADSSSVAADKFTYEITSTAVSGISINGSKLTVADNTAANESGYTVSIKATKQNPEFSLMSIDFGTEDTITFDVKVVVNKAGGSGSVSIEGWTYGESAKSPSPVSATNGTDNVTYQYKVKDADDNTYSTDIPTAAGSYTVKADFAETDNYKSAAATADFTIAKAAPTVTVPADLTATYGQTLA
ncbi:MAG: GLUG motif-containing protein, partial [Candidatus Ornithomonoglobus sp.]